jgi:hypothetical protein
MLYPAELWVPGEALLAGPFGGRKNFSALPQIFVLILERCERGSIGIERLQMINRANQSRFVVALLLLTGGCAAPRAASFPSLLPRPIESRSDAEPVAPVTIVEAEPATDATLVDLEKAIDAAAKTFDAAADGADRLARAAQGDAVGSDRWIAEQTALGQLDGLRATTSSAITDLDELALTRAAAGKPDYPAIATLRQKAQAALQAQAARIQEIQARLKPA